MLIGLLIVNKNGFPFYEMFSKDKTKSAIELVKLISNFGGDWDHKVYDEFKFRRLMINEKFYLVVIYKEENLTDKIEGNLVKISKQLLNGDKMAMQQLQKLKSLNNLEYVI